MKALKLYDEQCSHPADTQAVAEILVSYHSNEISLESLYNLISILTMNVPGSCCEPKATTLHVTRDEETLITWLTVGEGKKSTNTVSTG